MFTYKKAPYKIFALAPNFVGPALTRICIIHVGFTLLYLLHYKYNMYYTTDNFTMLGYVLYLLHDKILDSISYE